MRSGLRWALGLAAVVAIIILLRATVFRQRPLEVEAARVAQGLVEDTVTNSQAGTVRSRLRSRVGVERAGRVVDIPYREGAEVRRGDIILRLDTATAETQKELAGRDLEAQQAAVDAAAAAAVQARQDYERVSRLQTGNMVSQAELDQARTKLDAAEANLNAARARLESARSSVRLAAQEVNDLLVGAPFEGVITQRLVEVGESVIPGQPVLEVMSPDSLYVSAPIDEIDISRIHQGLPARVTLDPYKGMTWQGVVSRVSPYVNDTREQNRTLEVEVDLLRDANLPRPKPGTSADVEIILETHENVLRVPTFSVIENKRVLVVQDGRAVSRNVTTGLRNWEWTEIVSGLSEGDQVVTNLDKQGLAPGSRVKVTRVSGAGAEGDVAGKAAAGTGP